MSRARPPCGPHAARYSHPEVTEMPPLAVPSRLALRVFAARAILYLVLLLVTAALGVTTATGVGPRVHPIRHARLVTGPGSVIPPGTIVIPGGRLPGGRAG